MEIWKDIEGYVGLYQVSNMGRVKSLPKKKGRGEGYIKQEELLSCSKTGRGYPHVVLCKDSKTKTFSVHKLVALAFLENPNNLPEVDHKDRNKENNNVDNLRWVTTSENNLNRKNGKPVICVETGRVFNSATEVERELGLFATSIIACCRSKRKQKTCGKLHWKYYEEAV